MSELDDELDDWLDKVVFLEFYSWGILYSCWHADGKFGKYSVSPNPYARSQ